MAPLRTADPFQLTSPILKHGASPNAHSDPVLRIKKIEQKNQKNQEQLTKDKAELQRLKGKGREGKGGKWAGKLEWGGIEVSRRCYI